MKRRIFIIGAVAIATASCSQKPKKDLFDDIDSAIQRAMAEKREDVAAVLTYLQGSMVHGKTDELAKLCANWSREAGITPGK